MLKGLHVYNSLTGEKELFEPINAPFVGMYVCGPTVYSDVHLGNVRTFISFDIIFRYLLYLNYKVRYVRNITDVGHLENDSDEGEDKILKKAKLENLEPMEIVQRYTTGFHKVLELFNVKSPNIEPIATGHIIEQIEMIKKLLDNGHAYVVSGSVYFDVGKFNESHNYGILSGRKIEDLLVGTRTLDGQEQKRSPLDFALWKKASAEHLMQWDSPWGNGFPGWHLECSVMSTKYLGERFDIHGGGMDLKFPHHECEIAQSKSAYGEEPVKYWIHTNMLTVNGQKMSKSLGNSFLPSELFSGNHELLDQAYSPMTVRFLMLQSHYSSTLDFSNDALKAARKGYKKLVNGFKILNDLEYPESVKINENAELKSQIDRWCDGCQMAMNDDFNTALAIANLFNLLKKINSLQNGSLDFSQLSIDTFDKLKQTFISYFEDILGLFEENPADTDHMIRCIVKLYKDAKHHKDYETVDKIRDELKSSGIILKDMKTGIDWAYEE